MSPARKKSGPRFDKALQKLEEIVERLEDEQIPLEESLKLYAEGKRLAKACAEQLEEAENKVRQLMEDADGVLTETALEPAQAAGEAPEVKEEDDEDPSGKDDTASSIARGKDDLPF